MKHRITLAVLSFLALPVAAQEGLTLERPGDGRRVCGLGKAFHAGRRAALMERVGEELMVFRGMREVSENFAFRQDKTFWYLTGIESPKAALVLDGKTGRAVLFLPERTRGLLMEETWEGEKWDASDEWVSELTGFDDVRPDGELLDVIEELLADRERIGVSLHPPILLGGSYDQAARMLDDQREDPFDGRPGMPEMLARRLEEKLDVETFDVAPAIVELRRVKTPEEIAAMRRAASAGAVAMAEAIRSSRPGLGEWDLDALMRFVHIRQGAAGSAYNAIVGAGENACILHYTANSERIEDGEVVLIDFGPEVDHYVTDITRSWPANGSFTDRQAELYEAVLAAQKAGIAAVKPGVTIWDVDAACRKVLREAGFEKLVRHSACHYIGMEVHDPGNTRAPLEPGVAFTVEPGLYDDEAGIGIRIEDVVVVTEDGCEVLSSLVPKEREEIEALVREEGVLDRTDGKSD